ncbi:MAG: hypothetical protein ACI87E_000407 [Mariniblastus sp.]|jgi:hypothetical protein
MSRESKKLLNKQWNKNGKKMNTKMTYQDRFDEDPMQWNSHDMPVDGVESAEDCEINDADVYEANVYEDVDSYYDYEDDSEEA